MRRTAWAIVGSLVISLMLGLVATAIFSASPPAGAAETAQCPTHGGRAGRTTPSQPAYPRHRYIVAVRMGWAMG